jgi:hypothetical protein
VTRLYDAAGWTGTSSADDEPAGLCTQDLKSRESECGVTLAGTTAHVASGQERRANAPDSGEQFESQRLAHLFVKHNMARCHIRVCVHSEKRGLCHNTSSVSQSVPR